MPDDPRVQQLIEEILESGKTAEEVCQLAPELLREVRDGWRSCLAVQAQVLVLFPDPESEGDAGPLLPVGGLPQLPGYDVSDVLGHGGVGVVYKAQHLRLKRTVALKMLLAGAYAAPHERKRFQHETEAVAALRHENIVQIYEVGDLGGRPYFTMEFVEGGNLADYLAGTPQPGRPSAELLATLARAVQFAHDCGIIHRDLKPANILLQPAGTGRTPAQGAPGATPQQVVPKISDFGLAKLSRGPDFTEVSMTNPGAIAGTPAYVAPEIMMGRDAVVSPSVDIYSLGVILYEMLTGRPPFRGVTAMETLVQATELDAIPPRRLVPQVPLDLQTVCLKCLEKDPQKRYPTAGALAADLERFLNREPILARPAGSLERTLRWAGRHKDVTAALAGAGLLLVLLVIGSILAAAHFRTLELQQSNLAAQRGRLAEEKGRLASEKEAERAKAVQAEKREGELRKQAESQGEEFRRKLYVARMNLAGQSAASPSGLGRVTEALDGWDRDPPDLRGWEWFYLKGLCHRDQVTPLGRVHGSEVAWCPDGGTLATADASGTVYLWDPGGAEDPRILRGHSHVISALAWSPDGRRLATASWDTTIKLWDVADGHELATLRGHDGEVLAVAWSPDGTKLVSGGADRSVRVWDEATGAALKILRGHTLPVSGIAWSPDGHRFASSSRDETTKIWDAGSGKVIRTLIGHNNWVNGVAWSPDGKRLASVSNDKTARIWNPDDGTQLVVLRGHAEGVISVAWSPDASRLATASEDRTVKVWPAAKGSEAFTLRGHTEAVKSVAWSPDGRLLASAGLDSSVKLWDSAGHPETLSLRGHDGPVRALAWSRGPQPLLTSAGEDGIIRAWDVARSKEQFLLHGHEGLVRALAWSPDGSRLASGGNDQTVRIWDTATSKETACLRGHARSVFAVAWSPDGKRLASAGADATVRLWDAELGREYGTCRGHTYQIYAVAWSPDGKRLASACGDNTVKLWDTETGQELFTFHEHTGEVTTVAWSHDGLWLASGGYDETVKVWDPSGSNASHTLRGHRSRVNSVVWSPDGTRLASGATDRTVKVWDVATAGEILTLGGHADQVDAVAWSPDAMMLASAGTDGLIQVHDASAGYLAARAPSSLTLLDRRLVADPQDKAAWRLRAEVHARLEDWNEAAADVRKLLELSRGRRWLIVDAWAAGPYPDDLGASYAPEQAFLADRSARQGAARPLDRIWRTIALDPRGFVDFAAVLGRADHISAYALLRVYSPEKRPVAILVGSDDQVRLWLNGTRIHEQLSPRIAKADEDAVAATLQPGWNSVLARVVNVTRDHSLFLRLSDAPEDLTRARAGGSPEPRF